MKNKEVQLVLIRSKDQPADFLTKPLPIALFEACCSKSGLLLIDQDRATLQDMKTAQDEE